MIERGSGPTSGPTGGLTNWQLMDVVTMWAAIGDHDTDNHWKHVTGWRKTSELALMHLSRLKEYRRGLAEAWPPEKSAASRAYVAELDALIDTVQRTHDVAAANYSALAAATSAISGTRTELKKLYEQYEEKRKRKLAYETLLADPLAVAGSRLPDRPPVTEGELEQLNTSARTLMTGLSGELQQAQAMLRQPPPPPTRIGRDPANPDVYGGGAAPVIPPIVPVPLSPSVSPRPISRSTSSARPVATVNGVGPVISGTGPTIVPAQAAPTLPGVTPPVPPAPSVPPGIGPGLPPSVPPISTFPQSGTTGTRGGSPLGPLGRPTGGATGLPHGAPVGPRPLPPGGLIGGVPGMGLGQPAPGPAQPRRVNPIGGVIGGGAAGTAPTGAAGSRPRVGRGPTITGVHGMPPSFGAAPGIGGPLSRPARRDRDETEARRWDPDNPWETDRGVDPVVLPPEEDGPIDPGPAIGFNR